ncbi:MAG: thiamine pyrophosphate-dependent enzyme [Candidatus Hydrogenedentota bacterium]
MATKILDLPEEEFMFPGNRACAGCSVGIAFRHITKALEGKCIFTVPASCLTVLGGMYPTSSVSVPWMNTVFPSTAAAASGLAAGLKALGKGEITVVAMAGDGGTADIGLQALSGAAERNANILYICYDNEAYMNTGTQRSGSTPRGAHTTTTPILGKQQNQKDMPAIMEAHGVPYIATGCPSYPTDLYDKVRHAREIEGTRYMHLCAPCPSGWQFPTKDTVTIGQLAVETGCVVLFEVDHGRFRLTGRSRRLAQSGRPLTPLSDYIERQGRFKGMPQEMLDAQQEFVNTRWDRLCARDTSLTQKTAT